MSEVFASCHVFSDHGNVRMLTADFVDAKLDVIFDALRRFDAGLKQARIPSARLSNPISSGTAVAQRERERESLRAGSLGI